VASLVFTTAAAPALVVPAKLFMWSGNASIEDLFEYSYHLLLLRLFLSLVVRRYNSVSSFSFTVPSF
jgi:hypothetical protein